MIIFPSNVKDLPPQKCLFFMPGSNIYFFGQRYSVLRSPLQNCTLFKKTRPTIKYYCVNVVPLKTSWFPRLESWNKTDDLRPSAYLHIVGVYKCPLVWKTLNYTDFQTKESYILLPFSQLSASVQRKTNCSRENHVLRATIIMCNKFLLGNESHSHQERKI